MMKKVTAILLSVLMLLSMAACGGSAPSSPTEEPADAQQDSPASELVVWLPPQTEGDTFDQQFWIDMFEPWEKANNCKIDLTIVPWDSYVEKYLTAFSSGEGPDVGYMYNEMLYDYIDLGLIAELDPFLTDADRAEYLHLNLGQVNGRQYTMPLFPAGARVLYYNQDILDAAEVSVPTTWEEFVAACLKIKESAPNVIPFAQAWAGDGFGLLNQNFYPFMWSAGGELMDLDGTVTLMDNDGALRAAQFIYDLMYTYQVMPEDCIGWSEADTLQMLTDGEVAFMIYAVDSADSLAASSANIKFTGGLGETDGSEWKSWIAADALVLNEASEQKELAWSLIKYITSPEVMEQVHLTLANAPTLTKSETPTMSAEAVEIYEQAEHFQALPVAKNANAVMSNLKSNLQLMLLGDLTPEEAIQNTVDYSATLN